MDVYDEYLNKYFTTSFREGYQRYNGCFLPVAFGKLQKKISEWEVREQDIWIDTFPKAGKNFRHFIS